MAAAFPPLYFADERGNELAIFRSGEDPRGVLRVPTRFGADYIFGPLRSEQGHIMITMWIGEESPDAAGLRAHVYHDAEFKGVRVECEALGQTPVGLPPKVPAGDGEYRPVEPSERLVLARTEATAADQQLGDTLQKLDARPETHPALKDLLAQQADWAAARVATAESAVPDHVASADPSESPEYWQAYAEQTRDRELVLVAASGLEAASGYSGNYVDGYGGHLEIGVAGGEGEGGDMLDFHFLVVRGPTAHTGEISGVAPFSGPTTAEFVDSDPEAFWEGNPAKLHFDFNEHIVTVEGENTAYYHGARAYFDGVYFRLPPQ